MISTNKCVQKVKVSSYQYAQRDKKTSMPRETRRWVPTETRWVCPERQEDEYPQRQNEYAQRDKKMSMHRETRRWVCAERQEQVSVQAYKPDKMAKNSLRRFCCRCFHQHMVMKTTSSRSMMPSTMPRITGWSKPPASRRLVGGISFCLSSGAGIGVNRWPGVRPSSAEKSHPTTKRALINDWTTSKWRDR